MGQLSLQSPIGALTVSEEDGVIVSVDWGWGAEQAETSLLLRARDQLNSYFDGERKVFDLPLRPHGTAFQRRVWQLMSGIPYGQTLTYGDMAKTLKTSPRAVGLACGANPIPIIIPCHRVVSAHGDAGGYSGDGGTATKLALLRLEGVPGYGPDLFG